MEVHYSKIEAEHVRFAVYACGDCGLSFDEEKEAWRDEDDRPWTMAESGT